MCFDSVTEKECGREEGRFHTKRRVGWGTSGVPNSMTSGETSPTR